MEKEKFEYLDSMSNLQEIEISKDDFKFAQQDTKIHDVKIKSKPVTFFKDAMRRFVKNKSSVAGGAILGLIIISAIIGPEIMPKFGCFDVNTTHVMSADGVKSEIYLPPKLFEAGTGFFDGTISKSDIVFDQVAEQPVGYEIRTVSNLKKTEQYLDQAAKYGTGGFINLTYNNLSNDEIADFYSYKYDYDFLNDYTIEYRFIKPYVSGYKEAKYRISLMTLSGKEKTYYPLTGNDLTYVPFTQETDNKEGFITTLFDKNEQGTISINVSEIMSTKYGISSLEGGRINIDVLTDREKDKSSIFIEKLLISSSSDTNTDSVSLRSIEYANDCAIQEQKASEDGKIDKVFNKKYWTSLSSSRSIHDVKFVKCSFTYDIYEDCYGVKLMKIPAFKINEWINTGLITYDPTGGPTEDKEVLASRYQSLSKKDPIVEIIRQEGNAIWNNEDRNYTGFYLYCNISQYKYLGYPFKPKYLFGTDQYGRDYLKTILTSLRLSLVLAFGCALLNILIGIVWGSISGYFGGIVDITMERFCDIVSGLPSIAIITLCLLHFKNDMLAFIISMFMTGWMGVAGRTRTQFYRYKGREYVLASRTLGARDGRLIFRHILPNAMGTIITSSILMIPSVIYSEASIAYLGLGLKGQLMFGVILTENSNIFQGYTMYLLIIPTIIMAFLLVSFNLFGNGLRDAFNPSLKGED